MANFPRERKPTYRDRNGNTRTKWRRAHISYKDGTEYTLKYGSVDGYIMTYPDWRKGEHARKPFRWFLDLNGKRVKEGWSKSLADAKNDVENEIEKARGRR